MCFTNEELKKNAYDEDKWLRHLKKVFGMISTSYESKDFMTKRFHGLKQLLSSHSYVCMSVPLAGPQAVLAGPHILLAGPQTPSGWLLDPLAGPQTLWLTLRPFLLAINSL